MTKNSCFKNKENSQNQNVAFINIFKVDVKPLSFYIKSFKCYFNTFE